MSEKAEVVISGVSGVFPESNNVTEFKENLFAKKNLTTTDHRRWNPDLLKCNSKIGKIKDLSKFDHSFFRVHRKYANRMTPASRILLEQAYEAIVDAGYNPEELRNTNTGVYIAISANDVEDDAAAKSRAIIANRISYWLDIYGPSCSIDSACSSSFYALEKACQDISNGICDAALIGGFSLCLTSDVNVAYTKSGVLSRTGLCRPFDEAAEGFTRAEAIVTMFLQKKQNARRIYANIIDMRVNCDGFKEEGFNCPSGKTHKRLYGELYKETGISPASVSYIEAHGTGTKIGDIVEVNAIEEFFCKDRSDVLKIGSLKSNMGHAEACAGLCSLVKMIISFETGLIPPNINLRNLNPKIPAFHNGKIEVVTEATPCRGNFFAVNSFGIGGANGHALLSPHTKEKKKCNLKNTELPQLVLVSGRTKEAIEVLIKNLEENHSDFEYVHLLRDVFQNRIDGHLYRGYFLKSEGKESIKSAQNITEKRRPVWFVFTGMGCQWPGMGKDLLRIPIFAESIRQSHEFLESKGLDLMKIITEEDPHMFDSILHSFVGIAAIQIALVNILNALEIVPNGIIGHSVGEVGCGYADGCLTAEQTLLAAYYRGLISMTNDFGKGLMAAIDLPYDDLKKSLPPEIDIACHNTETNYTISGPADIVRKYVENMQSQGVWVRHVNTSGIAYHGRYIALAGPKLLSNLEKVITNPKPRSEKWICTSAPEIQWETDTIKYASAEYYTNNLLSSVYFKQGSKHIPHNALVIEIGPHGLLQAILKKSLPSSVENIPLATKNHDDNVTFFLNAIGKVHVNGIDPKIKNLYPSIEYPVSRGTPMIAPLIRWQHDEDWYVPRECSQTNKSRERTFIIDVKSEEYKYLKGHIIDGRNLFPGVEYLNLIWESIATIQGKPQSETAVVFEDVRFLRATHILDKDIEFHTSIQKGTGNFEIVESDSVVVNGRVYLLEDADEKNTSYYDWSSFPRDELPLKTRDVYKVLRLKGFQYQGLFRNLLSADSEGKFCKLGWRDNFVTFLDSLAHLKILTQDTNELVLPTFIRKAVINPIKHYQVLKNLDGENPEFLAHHNKNCSTLQSGGVQIFGLKFSAIPRRKETKDVVLEKYQFVANFHDSKIPLNIAVRVCTNIVIENLQLLKVKSIEILQQKDDTRELISTYISRALNEWPLIQAEVSVYVENEFEIELEDSNEIKVVRGNLPENKNCSIVTVTNLFQQKEQLPQFLEVLRPNGFIIARERQFDEKIYENLSLDIHYHRIVGNEHIILLRKKLTTLTKIPPIVVKVDNFSLEWISEIRKIIKKIDQKSDQKLVLYSEKDASSGILGFYNCLRKEYADDIFRCFFIMDKNAPKFSLDNLLYKSQFLKNISHNVYKNAKWGTYRHLPLEHSNEKKCRHAFANVSVRGDLSTVKWLEGPLNPINHKGDESLLHVYYAALNFRDIVFATGKVSVLDICESRLEEQATLGTEISGKDENGGRFMAAAWTNSLSSLVLCDTVMKWNVPDNMTLEEAATIPITYATALYALVTHGQIRNGQSVLIHAGTGGVGLSCIHICIHFGCNIFTTVGTPEKNEYIKKHFPQIPESQIGNSRDTSFEKMVMEGTNGRGVDLLVNSLSEDKFHASLRCMARLGKFLEIGKYDMSKNTSMDSNNFIGGVSFHSVMFDCFMHAPKADKLIFRDEMQKLINIGVVKPLQRTMFLPENIESAFRYMAAGRHIGKVLIKIRDEEPNIKCKPSPFYMNAYPRVTCNNNQVYVVIGGLGGFGLELADWLILRGARIIILNSQTGIKNGYQLFKTEQWKSYGVNVLINTDDTTTETGVKLLLKLANSLGPVTGIFNLAVLLRDKPFEEQTTELFMESAGPKAMATIHLDRMSRLMCPDLQYFVVFSSVSCGRGNASQTNYGMFNSVMERICETRKEDNLPGLAIQWGAVGDVGLVADMAEENKTVVIGGTLQQKINSCLETLDLFMKQENAIVSSMIVAEKYRSYSNIANVAANILGIKDLKSISLNWTLPQLGLDSMMATELKQILEAEFEMFLTQKDIQNLTFNKLLAIAEGDPKRQTVATGIPTMRSSIHIFNVDEIRKPIVRIPCLTDEGSTMEVDSQSNPTLFVFPGIEGLAKFMEPLGESFNVQLLCLQYHFDMPHTDFKNLAEKLLPQITKRIPPSQQFRIIAYSFGASTAIEVLRLLEERYYVGKIWFIDGAPLYVEKVFLEHCKNPNSPQDNTENLILIKCIKALTPNPMDDELYNNLCERETWESKVEFLFTMFDNHVQSKATMELIFEYARSVCVMMRTKVLPGQPLRSVASLIRCSTNAYKIPEDYDLSKYFEKPVQVNYVESDHDSIFKDKRTAEILMKDFI